MNTPHTPYLNKIVNPHLARVALHAAEPCGEFRVIIQLASPNKCPRYIKATGLISSNRIRARIPCNQIERASRDRNVVSIELREHVMQ